MKTIVSCHCEFGHSKKLKRIFDNKSFEGYYYGIKNLVELSEKYNVKLSLFLMPCFLTLEKDMKNNIIDLLLRIKDKHELGLHIHPGWYNANYQNGRWQLDYSEYNLSVLSRERIAQIIDHWIRFY